MSQVDLSALRIDDSQAIVPKRPIGPRLMVAAVLLLALAVAATFLVPVIWPARTVRTVAVRPASQVVAQAAVGGTEAVGWVEADPYATIVRPLVSGHLETLEVLEGATVVANETVVGRLVSAELTAAHDRAKAMVTEKVALQTQAAANATLAAERLAQNADAVLRVQEAEAKHVALRTKLDMANAKLRQAEASAEAALANVKAQERLQAAGKSFPVALQRATAEADAAAATIAAGKAEISGLRAELEQQRDTIAICKEFAADPVDLRGAAAVAQGELDKARAELAKARVDLAIAERELEWAVVKSPVDGVVLRLESEPGDMVGHGAEGIVAVYDPKKLRARIDVPIDSLDGIHEGQHVEITSAAIGDTIVKGVVQRFQHETDMLKNTLQVKIGLIDPPALLRPETLCRARFLADPSKQPAEGPRTVRAWRVPKAAVRDGRVHVFDPKSGRARAVTVTAAGEDGDDAIVRGDLSPTHRVVLDPVTDGEAIQEATQ